MLEYLHMQSLEYLSNYYQFEDEVLARVSDAAEEQDSKTFIELADRYTVAENYLTVHIGNGHKPFDALTFVPDTDYDESTMRVYHLPMANSISDNMIMRGMRLFAADDSQPLMLVGNPSSPGHGAGRVSVRQAGWAMRHQSLRPYIDPLLEHLYNTNVTNVAHIGYSYGADKAMAASEYAHQFDQYVTAGIYMEPVSVIKRSMGRLALAFGSSNSELERYIKQSASPPYQSIRDQENMAGLIGYAAGLGRLSNVAVSSLLASDSFERRARATLDNQPTDLRVAWGDKSELVDNHAMLASLERLEHTYPGRIVPLPMRGMHHAGGDDINLHAAMVLQGLLAT